MQKKKLESGKREEWKSARARERERERERERTGQEWVSSRYVCIYIRIYVSYVCMQEGMDTYM